MIRPFLDAGLEVSFYPVYAENGLIQEVKGNCDALLVMDFFGYSGEKADLKGYDGIVIRDVTHSIFSKTYDDADYYFGSLRKWCGVWTGGYAWSADGKALDTGRPYDPEYVSLREEAMLLKDQYIRGLGDWNKSYLQLFGKAEDMLEDAGIESAHEGDVLAARRLNVDMIREKRRSNAAKLRDAFKDIIIFPEMKDSDCPLFVPVMVPENKRDELRRYLIEREIYCPVHWPVSEYHKLNDKTEEIYRNELSLVCDQRYSSADMDRMIDTIEAFWKEA
ncbi:MAG: hypothetical protein IKI86_05810 [Firmicutes bacterium]|nr:hypothetical protein [Bacillota bacterium]